MILSMLKHSEKYIKHESYYPNEPHKSNCEILRDQIGYVWKYGCVEKHYFTYGFDRKIMTKEKMKTYLTPFTMFQLKLDHLNFQNPYYDDFMGKITCRVINQDKFYFYLFFSKLNIPTPKLYMYVRRGELLFLDDGINGIGDDVSSIRNRLLAFFKHDIDAFAKPSDGMLGKGVFHLVIKNGEIWMNDEKSNVDELINTLMSADYIVQERIVQHPALSKLCSTCVNTIRLQTVMDSEGNVIPFGAGIRIGRFGSVVDNWAKGGIFVGINPETGTLMDRGVLKPSYGTSVAHHPDSGIIFEGYQIPFYQQAVEMAIYAHKMMYRSHSIGWDIAITNQGPVIIEGNDRWEISLVQAVHGGLAYLYKYFDY